MAQFIPTIAKIRQFRVQPTKGEWALLRFLEQVLDDSFEVYFNPFLNGDRPDVVIMRRGGGVMIIEVKDWDLASYVLDEKKHWHLAYPKNEAEKQSYIKSPIDQACQYKDNLYNLHVEKLLEQNIKNTKMWGVVVVGVYFHCASRQQVKDKIVTPYERELGYKKFIDHIALLGNDDLNKDSFMSVLERFNIISRQPSQLFTDELYNSIHRLLLPPLHLQSQGIYLSRYDGRLKSQNPTIPMYSKKQDELIYDKARRKEWRVKGVVGSGKTTMLAAKAVQSYNELVEQGIQSPKILILTYNITLRNFIHDKIQRVHENFDWASFTILHYHQFIKSQLNNLGIDFRREDGESDEQFFARYFDNYQLFEERKDETERFDVIFIDEIQDYKRVWMDIVKDFFLYQGGDYPRSGYYLLGDVKQNIYNRGTVGKDVVTNVRGVNTLDTCFRSEMKIKDLALGFQRLYFGDKYEIDESLTSEQDTLFVDQNLQQGYLNYIPLQSTNPIQTVFNIIDGNIKNRVSGAANDITVLGADMRFLQLFEAYYRYKTGFRTSTMFETYELMYLQGIRQKSKIAPIELRGHLMKLIKRDTDYNPNTGEHQIADLLSAYEMYIQFPDVFKTRLEIKCREYKTTLGDFLAMMKRFEADFSKFRADVFNVDYKYIRDNKKFNFWMNTGNIKISTIHSFKGWESDTVFLIIQKHFEGNPTFNELLYTGITRTRSNLIVINLGNEEYHENMKRLIETYR